MIFYNPHIDDFLAEPLHFRLLKRRPLKKYGFFLDEIIRRDGKTDILVDTSLIPDGLFFLLPGFLRRNILKIETGWWIKRNHLQDKVNIHFSCEELNPGNILFFFSYKIAVGSFHKRKNTIEYFETKISHLSHYFVSTSLKSINLSQLTNLWLAGDTDISENAYFSFFFNWYHNPFLLLYFTIGKRFEIKKPLNGRINKCVATGTFHNLFEETPRWKYTDFTSFFKTSTYHPVRKVIFENREKWKHCIDARVSPYRSNEKGFFSKYIGHFLVSQKKYFSIDIVQLYNDHVYAVVGEEASGFPALGAFEAMACGCILFAQPGYYKGLPLQSGIHYIPYDGDPAFICEFIAAGSWSTDRLHQVSINNIQVVKEFFNASAIVDHFQEQLRTNKLIPVLIDA